MRLLVEIGEVCAEYQDKVFRNLPCRRIQVDEMWAFLYCKAKNLTPRIAQRNPSAGDIWLWVAMDADTKLVPSWFLGARDASAAEVLMLDLARRLSHRVQLTTDGHRAYLTAIESAFGDGIDYAMLVKIYGNPPEPDTRYSPGVCLDCKQERVARSRIIRRQSRLTISHTTSLRFTGHCAVRLLWRQALRTSYGTLLTWCVFGNPKSGGRKERHELA